MPAMLKQDQPVTVTSNRLDYDGVADATYSGNALLWQGNGSRISGDTIVLDDRTGNLVARGTCPDDDDHAGRRPEDESEDADRHERVVRSAGLR